MAVAPWGLLASGLLVFKRLPWLESLDLEARVSRFVPIGNGDLTHHGAAKSDGLRERSAGEARVMFVCQDHRNRIIGSIMQAPCQVNSYLQGPYDTQEPILAPHDKRRVKTGNPNISKLIKLKLTDPQRGIAQAKPVAKRGPQVPKSSKRP
jgi:hypothetical protein